MESVAAGFHFAHERGVVHHDVKQEKNHESSLAPLRLLCTLVLSGAVLSCSDTTMAMGPKTVVLFATPKIISDFANSEVDVNQFLDHYEPLISRASETIVIFAVGNSEHILEYRGKDYWDDGVEWARHTGFPSLRPVSEQALNYHQVEEIVRAFKSRAASVEPSSRSSTRSIRVGSSPIPTSRLIDIRNAWLANTRIATTFGRA